MSKSKKKLGKNDFHPTILCFCCNWCSYAGADLAGVSRFQYPSTIRIVRVMCSGRVDPAFILETFKNGIDGVIVTGCHIGDCHYLKGNEFARDRFQRFKNVLKIFNLDKRFRLEWVSASEGKRFAEIITEFSEQIKKLGPLQIIQNYYTKIFSIDN